MCFFLHLFSIMVIIMMLFALVLTWITHRNRVILLKRCYLDGDDRLPMDENTRLAYQHQIDCLKKKLASTLEVNKALSNKVRISNSNNSKILPTLRAAQSVHRSPVYPPDCFSFSVFFLRNLKKEELVTWGGTGCGKDTNGLHRSWYSTRNVGLCCLHYSFTKST